MSRRLKSATQQKPYSSNAAGYIIINRLKGKSGDPPPLKLGGQRKSGAIPVAVRL